MDRVCCQVYFVIIKAKMPLLDPSNHVARINRQTIWDPKMSGPCCSDRSILMLIGDITKKLFVN